MSDAYKCDRCALVIGGYPALHIMAGRTNRELCESCKADFARWMNRESTQVSQPKQGPQEDANAAEISRLKAEIEKLEAE